MAADALSPRPTAVGDDFFAALFAVSPAGIAIADQEGRYIDVNPAYCRLFGYRREELLGRSFGLILLPEERHLEKAILAIALTPLPAGEICPEPTLWNVCARDGRRLVVSATYRSLRDRDGALRIITTLTDVTDLQDTITRLGESEARLQQLNEQLEERVLARTRELENANQDLAAAVAQLERAQQFLGESILANRRMLETAHDAVVSMDGEGRVAAWNEAAERLFGWPAEAALGRSLAELIIPEGWRAAHEAGFRRLLAGEWASLNRSMEVTALSREKREFPAEISLWSHEMGGEPRFSAFIRDITLRRRAEEETRRALAQAEELAELKSRFLSMATHELRNPLTILQSSADLLLSCREHLEEGEVARILGDIQGSVARMQGLLDQVLFIGRAEARRLAFQPRPLDLAAWCRERVEQLSRSRQGGERIHYRVEYRGAPLPSARRSADEGLLHHMVDNLLGNALKYSPAGEAVHFTLHLAPDHLVLEVADRGIGIPEDEQDQLFQAFFRARNAQALPGTGLGLSIVKRAVDAHGGRLDFSSRPGEGSTFRVWLPLAADEGA